MKRFRTLRLVVVILRVLGWVAIVIGMLVSAACAVGGLLSGRIPLIAALLRSSLRWPPLPPPVVGLVWAIVTIIGALAYFVAFYGLSELLELALALEENTREMSRYLRGEDDSPAA